MKAVLNYNQFEEIFLNPEIFKDWNNILKHHTELELSISQDEIQNLESDINSVLFHFINATGGKYCDTFSNEIDVDHNPSYILFDEAFSDRNKGCLIIDKKTLENPFQLNYAKTLAKNSSVEFHLLKGWKFLLDSKVTDSNTIILNDSYLFDDKENQSRIGSKNILDLLDAMLPEQLDVPYHILINTTTSKNKTNTFYDSFIPDLIKEIASLRYYEMVIEIIIGEGFHKRKLYTNFLNITTDKGFKIFDKKDESKVLDHNDITIETMFTRNDPAQGDSQFDEMKIRLTELRKLVKNSLDWIKSESYNNTRSFYYSNINQEGKIEINNRLINNL